MHRLLQTQMNPCHYPSVNGETKGQMLPLADVLRSVSSRTDQLRELIRLAITKCHFPSEHHLTLDESAAIYLFTMKWEKDSFYELLQRDLQSNDSSLVQSWSPYLQFFHSAVLKLPNTRVKVWSRTTEDFCETLTIDNELVWSQPTLCSSSMEIIKDSRLCTIDTIYGKDISIYSHIPNRKDIILCAGTRLKVVSNVQNQLYLRECPRFLPAFSSLIHDRIKNRLPSILPHLLALILAISLALLTGKAVSKIQSSYLTTLMNSSYYQLIQTIASSKSSFDHPTAMTQPSTDEIQADPYGNRYEGEYFNGKKHGQGIMHFANGCTYRGHWLDDTPMGEGVFTWTNGDHYEGEFKEGQRDGKGSYYFANGDKYIGDWIGDKKHGSGISSLAVGRYEGQFIDDKMHGKGSFYFADGGSYDGDWIDNNQEGEGIFTWPNGNRYEGGFKAGKLHGKGSYYFGNGNKFTGEWIDGERMTEHGSFIWANVQRRSQENEKEQ